MNLLLDPVIDNNYDLVLANRRHAKTPKTAFTPPQKWGTKLILICMRLLWGFTFNDLGPFRAMKRKELINLKMNDKNYGWTMEMQIRAIKGNLKIIEIDVPYRERQAGKSKVSGSLRGVVLAGLKMLFRLFYYKVESLFKTGNAT